MTPGVPGTSGVPGVPGALAAAAAAAFALLLLGGLDGVAEGADGVPGIETVAGTKGADVEVPIGTPFAPSIGAADVEANDGAELLGVPGMDPYIMGGPSRGDGAAKPFGPGGGMDIDVTCGRFAPGGNGYAPGVPAGVLRPEYGLGMASDPVAGPPAPIEPTGTADGAGVAADVETGDGGAGVFGSGGGVKMPKRCLASRSFSSLAALAAALSC